MVMKAIERETFNALSGKKAAIIAKMNSLVENQVIRALYRASQAGVKITLIIRGACALRPQSPGISDNITVKSVVGRFLEHHRVFYFYDSGNEDVFISSADWMKRNFFKRVETCIPILNPKIKQRVIDESLTLYIQDNVNSWQMDSAGNYTQAPLVGKAVSAQDFLMNKLGLPGIKETLANKLIEQAAKLPAVVAEDVLLAKPIRKPRATRSTAKATVESTSAVRKPRVRKTVV
jgi:polyphosphate kinase